MKIRAILLLHLLAIGCIINAAPVEISTVTAVLSSPPYTIPPRTFPNTGDVPVVVPSRLARYTTTTLRSGDGSTLTRILISSP